MYQFRNVCVPILEHTLDFRLKEIYTTPMEKTLEEKYKLLESIIENSTDAIQISDKNLVTVMVNRAYEVLTGISRKEQLGIPVEVLVERGLISESCADIVRRTGQPRTIIQTFKRTGRSAHVSCKPLYDENGEIEYYMCNDRDLDEINSLTKELKTTITLKDHYMNELAKIKANDAAITGFIADDENSIKTLGEVLRSANSNSPVLFTGETGVGKTELARILHLNSPRSNREFISINCASLSEEHFEQELFGREADLSAGREVRLGILDAANGSTLLLDEISELPLALQKKFLDVIQTNSFKRVGGSSPVNVDIRFVASTNADMDRMVRTKSFRKDLYYRINVTSINVPPLRTRKNDIIPLSLHFLKIHNKRHNMNKDFAPGALYSLLNEQWEGNIRQLRNEIEHALLFCESDIITQSDFRFEQKKDFTDEVYSIYTESKTLADHLAYIEYKNLTRAYEDTGNFRDAASSLGMKTTTFVRHLKALESSFNSK